MNLKKNLTDGFPLHRQACFLILLDDFFDKPTNLMMTPSLPLCQCLLLCPPLIGEAFLVVITAMNAKRFEPDYRISS